VVAYARNDPPTIRVLYVLLCVRLYTRIYVHFIQRTYANTHGITMAGNGIMAYERMWSFTYFLPSLCRWHKRPKVNSAPEWLDVYRCDCRGRCLCLCTWNI